ncbi:MAG: HNH endonuclease signature motif containing protein [Pseudomonadota bacterium]
MLRKQGGICPECKSRLSNEDLMEAHHVVHRCKGGKDEYSNLVLLHRHCHDRRHAEEIKNLQRSNGTFNTTGKISSVVVVSTKTRECFIDGSHSS